MILNRSLHAAVRLSGRSEHQKFLKSLHHPEKAQSEVLKRILKNPLPWSPQNRDLITTWKDYESFFDENQRDQWLTQKVVKRFEPTSGSTFERKWIPYTSGFLNEINRAASCWMTDLYDQFPNIRSGFHYWSLSWLPMELRKGLSNDDSELFPWWKRWLLSQIFVVPPQLARVDSEEAWRLATLVYLLSDRAPSFVSVWSPTFLLSLMQSQKDLRPLIEACVQQKKWVGFEVTLKQIPFPPVGPTFDFENLQKKLGLISCWTSASSGPFLENLKVQFSKSFIQSKGLWATEGVVTFPFARKLPLAVNSHYYEFRDLQSGKILLSHQLQKGQMLSVLLTTSAGLVRYELGDHVQVSEFLAATPCLEFLGRPGTLDLVGEKLEFQVFHEIKQRLQAENPELQFLQFGFKREGTPQYFLLVKKTSYSEKLKFALQDQVEVRLQKHHHYRVARQLQQLKPAEILLVPEGFQWNFTLSAQKILGQQKPTDLLEIKDDLYLRLQN